MNIKKTLKWNKKNIISRDNNLDKRVAIITTSLSCFINILISLIMMLVAYTVYYNTQEKSIIKLITILSLALVPIGICVGLIKRNKIIIYFNIILFLILFLLVVLVTLFGPYPLSDMSCNMIRLFGGLIFSYMLLLSLRGQIKMLQQQSDVDVGRVNLLPDTKMANGNDGNE